MNKLSFWEHVIASITLKGKSKEYNQRESYPNGNMITNHGWNLIKIHYRWKHSVSTIPLYNSL